VPTRRVPARLPECRHAQQQSQLFVSGRDERRDDVTRPVRDVSRKLFDQAVVGAAGTPLSVKPSVILDYLSRVTVTSSRHVQL
jgi:hypothetical protein